MILKYKKRIMQFIDKVAKKPREKGDEYSRKLEVAEKSYYKSRVLGEESIRLQHKFESARVNVTIIYSRLTGLGNGNEEQVDVGYSTE